jgi:PAS domain S-box-containing protein
VNDRHVASYGIYRDLTPRLETEAQDRERQRLLELFFSQSLEGFFFMMLDAPIRWDESADKERLLDQVFRELRVTRANDAMLAQYGLRREQLIGMTPADFYAHDPAAGRAGFRRFLDQGRLHTVTEERRADGSPVRIEGDYICLYDELGRFTGHFGIQRDITERDQQEQALRLSEEKFAKAFRSSPFPITIATLAEGRFVEVNEAFLKDVGFAREEVMGRTATELGLWMDPAKRAELVRRLERDGLVREFEFEARTRHRDHQVNVLWAERITIDGVPCMLDIVYDMTDRKRGEEALKASRQELRALAARLQTVREEERTRIARELHDELGQALTGLKLDLAWIRSRLAGREPELADCLLALMGRVDGTVEQVRRIATELRPGVLDLLGLVAAIEWQAQEFGRRTGVVTDLDIRSDQSPVDDTRATTIFRILQEALTNVARHAAASRVTIRYVQTRESIRLEVADDGRGFSVGDRAGGESLGLLGARERAIACGGELEIDGQPGRGTTLRVRVPCGVTGQHEAVA